MYRRCRAVNTVEVGRCTELTERTGWPLCRRHRLQCRNELNGCRIPYNNNSGSSGNFARTAGGLNNTGDLRWPATSAFDDQSTRRSGCQRRNVALKVCVVVTRRNFDLQLRSVQHCALDDSNLMSFLLTVSWPFNDGTCNRCSVDTCKPNLDCPVLLAFIIRQAPVDIKFYLMGIKFKIFVSVRLFDCLSPILSEKGRRVVYSKWMCDSPIFLLSGRLVLYFYLKIRLCNSARKRNSRPYTLAFLRSPAGTAAGIIFYLVATR